MRLYAFAGERPASAGSASGRYRDYTTRTSATPKAKDMDWHAIEAVTGVVCALATLISVYTALTVKAAIAKLRAEAAELRAVEAELRARERDEMKTWINGSFMRSKIVEAEINGMGARVGRLEGEVYGRRAA